MGFELFDPKSEFSINDGGHLPHWFQPGVTYFVTFRTADSVPQYLVRSWQQRREAWLRRHGIDPTSPKWRADLNQNPQAAVEFSDTFEAEFANWLDQGMGRCVLGKPELSAIVEECFRSGDGKRYCLGDFVVMPNHVHLLVGLIGMTKIEELCRSWKRFAATKINRLQGLKGRFWQEESFDHLVRSPEQFEYLQRYIADNPKRAGLKPGQFRHCRIRTSQG